MTCDDGALWERVHAAKFGDLLSIDDARTVLFRCNSYSALPRLINMWTAAEVEGRDWLRLLGEFWSTSDNIGALAHELLNETPLGDVVDSPGLRSLLMDDTEQAAFAALPEQVTLYRGCYAANQWGLSWSLDRDTAARFPTLHRYRQEGQPLLVTTRIAKGAIIAFKADRGEAEIIAHRPTHVSTSKLAGP